MRPLARARAPLCAEEQTALDHARRVRLIQFARETGNRALVAALEPLIEEAREKRRGSGATPARAIDRLFERPNR